MMTNIQPLSILSEHVTRWRQHYTSRLLCRCVLSTLIFLPLATLHAQSNYVAFELKRENNFDPLLTHDINGDGASDLIVSDYHPGIGRELLIYLQQPNGSFDANPVHVEIKTEIIAVGFADLRPEPGIELVLLANSGVFSLNAMQPGYAGNLKQLLSWDLIASMPNLEQVQFFEGVSDINNDGMADIILPGIDNYGIFYGQGNEQFELITTLSTINASTEAMERGNSGREPQATVSINTEEGIVLQLNSSSRTPFRNFIEQWQDTATDDEFMLQSEHWMPALLTGHLNNDDLMDLAYLNVGEDGLGQLNIHFQQSQGFAEQPDWTGSIDTRGQLSLIDINHDSMLDLLRLRGEGDDWTAQLFINKGAQFALQQPDQIMRFSGYDVELEFLQLVEDDEPTLSVSYYTIPVVDAIRNASINRTQLLYGSEQKSDEQLFNRRPDFRLEESFSAANVRGLSEQMSLKYDVDGDGSKDALYITANGTLAAKKISADLVIADEPFWEYLSNHTVFQFEVLSLNSDTIPDLLLRHGTSTTMLVGRQ